jgi:hypothetical protein
MMLAVFKENHGTPLPSFKKCTSHNVVNSGMIGGLTVQSPKESTLKGQH